MGRASEREHLLELTDQIATTGSGRVLLLEGEAGVGKTRLTMWLKEHLEERGAARGHIGVFTRGPGTGMSGAQEVVESLLRTRGLQGEALVDRIERRFRDWGETIAPAHARALATLVRPLSEDSDAEDGLLSQGPSARARLYAAAWHLLEVAS